MLYHRKLLSDVHMLNIGLQTSDFRHRTIHHLVKALNLSPTNHNNLLIFITIAEWKG